MIRAVLFDAVGTLIHLREPVGETYARFARGAGVAVAADDLQPAFVRVLRAMPPMAFPGQTPEGVCAGERDWWRRLVCRVFEEVGAAAQGSDFDACFARLWTHFAGGDAWRCAEGALELLQRLRGRGLHTGMVSNFDHRLPALLASLGLAPLLEVVVLPADAGAAKPDPRIFALALERLGVGAAEAVYVGNDAEDDVAGARRAGLRAIDVTTVTDLAELDWLLC